ncbi:hypothetical protein Cgig2_023541 [Carnegiea gigantea]|uniref:Uncharacterized protein n=1 Tax=Carnegiea gigantea TaxID=171969 RepID=A0A9Q1JTV5_9CARY|nr:hypothetical protein Cgig2_023541 [Carnegiea gigantea]
MGDNGVYFMSLVKFVKITLNHSILETIFRPKFTDSAPSKLTQKATKVEIYKCQNRTPRNHTLFLEPRLLHYVFVRKTVSCSQYQLFLPTPLKPFSSTKQPLELGSICLSLILKKPLLLKSNSLRILESLREDHAKLRIKWISCNLKWGCLAENEMT